MQLNTITNISSMVTNFSYNGHTVSELAVLVVTTVSGVFTILNHHAGNRGHRTYCLIITVGSSYVYFKLCSDNILGGHIKELENNVERFATENDTYATHNLQNQAQIGEFKKQNESLRGLVNNFGGNLDEGVKQLSEVTKQNKETADRLEAATAKHEAATAKHEAATAKLEAATEAAATKLEATATRNEASAAQFEQILQTPTDVSGIRLGSRFPTIEKKTAGTANNRENRRNNVNIGA